MCLYTLQTKVNCPGWILKTNQLRYKDKNDLKLIWTPCVATSHRFSKNTWSTATLSTSMKLQTTNISDKYSMTNITMTFRMTSFLSGTPIKSSCWPQQKKNWSQLQKKRNWRNWRKRRVKHPSVNSRWGNPRKPCSEQNSRGWPKSNLKRKS